MFKLPVSVYVLPNLWTALKSIHASKRVGRYFSQLQPQKFISTFLLCKLLASSPAYWPALLRLAMGFVFTRVSAANSPALGTNSRFSCTSTSCKSSYCVWHSLHLLNSINWWFATTMMCFILSKPYLGMMALGAICSFRSTTLMVLSKSGKHLIRNKKFTSTVRVHLT